MHPLMKLKILLEEVAEKAMFAEEYEASISNSTMHNSCSF